MVQETRNLEKVLGDGKKKIEKNELSSIIVQRFIRANQKLKKGVIIKENVNLFETLPIKSVMTK